VGSPLGAEINKLNWVIADLCEIVLYSQASVEISNIEQEISNDEVSRQYAEKSSISKMLHSFDIHCSVFDIRYFNNLKNRYKSLFSQYSKINVSPWLEGKGDEDRH
jgi:hypothetical protein